MPSIGHRHSSTRMPTYGTEFSITHFTNHYASAFCMFYFAFYLTHYVLCYSAFYQQPFEGVHFAVG